jgi:glycosyltransferase involved in cell wall biosynthesis
VEDTRPYLQRAEVAVVPLRAGSGTRLKILEAFAAGIPVVSTTIGSEGIAAQHGRHLLIADSAESFCHAVERLHADAGLRAELAGQARRLVKEAYDWDTIAGAVEEIAATVAARAARRGVRAA